MGLELMGLWDPWWVPLSHMLPFLQCPQDRPVLYGLPGAAVAGETLYHL